MSELKQSYIKKWVNTPFPSPDSGFETKMYSFGGPGGKKNIHKIYLTATASYGYLEVYYRTEVDAAYQYFGSIYIATTSGDTHELLPASTDGLKGINSIQFYFDLYSQAQSLTNVLKIDDINIVYRAYRELSIEEDD